jgi:hypothetical protein
MSKKYTVLVENQKEIAHLMDTGVAGRILLNCIL